VGKRINGAANKASENLRLARLEVDNGFAFRLKNGAVSLRYVVAGLPLERLKPMYEQLRASGPTYLVTEVERFDSATLRLVWSDTSDAKAGLDLLGILHLGGIAQWSKDSTEITFTYDKPVVATFKTIPVSMTIFEEALAKKSQEVSEKVAAEASARELQKQAQAAATITGASVEWTVLKGHKPRKDEIYGTLYVGSSVVARVGPNGYDDEWKEGDRRLIEFESKGFVPFPIAACPRMSVTWLKAGGNGDIDRIQWVLFAHRADRQDVKLHGEAGPIRNSDGPFTIPLGKDCPNR
jgi:hypothetical protein